MYDGQFLETTLHHIEQLHQKEAGMGGFCYMAIPYHDSLELWRLAIVRANNDGYWPISDDLFIGGQQAMHDKATELNQTRLKIYPRQAMMLIANSMANSRTLRRGNA